MRRVLSVFTVWLLVPTLAGPAQASPNCLRDNKPYKLAGDKIEWTMKIAPGADCIQGLRWSTMQIYKVNVLEAPQNGELVLVGPGFRYRARQDFSGADRFSLVVVGKNRHDPGESTIEITVSRASSPIVVSAAADFR